MKKVLAALLLLLLLTGCGPEQAPPEPEPLRFDTLTVEFAAEGGAELLPALNRMPEVLKAAFAEAGVAVEQVEVSLAASQDAAARAVGGGSVDLSFLSAEALLAADCGGVPLLADTMADALSLEAGTFTDICIGPSPYGQTLRQRESPTWEELSRARWGVLDRNNPAGSRMVSLWLADGWEGSTLEDLPQATVYESYEALLRAAAAEEIDVFPLLPQAGREMETAWTLEPTRTSSTGYRGFGREKPFSEEVFRLDSTSRWFSRFAAVREDPDLTGGAFQLALSQALDILREDGDFVRLAGAEWFSPLKEGQWDPMLRLLTIEG